MLEAHTTIVEKLSCGVLYIDYVSPFWLYELVVHLPSLVIVVKKMICTYLNEFTDLKKLNRYVCSNWIKKYIGYE